MQHLGRKIPDPIARRRRRTAAGAARRGRTRRIGDRRGRRRRRNRGRNRIDLRLEGIHIGGLRVTAVDELRHRIEQIPPGIDHGEFTRKLGQLCFDLRPALPGRGELLRVRRHLLLNALPLGIQLSLLLGQ
jgi:hypothetical protein